MAAARMQRWPLIHSTYEYTIQHIKGTSNQRVDCMSKLPITGQSRDSAEKILVIVQTDGLTVTASQVATESLRNSQLSIVMKTIQRGHWPTDMSVDINPLYKNDII